MFQQNSDGRDDLEISGSPSVNPLVLGFCRIFFLPTAVFLWENQRCFNACGEGNLLIQLVSNAVAQVIFIYICLE